MSLNRKNRKNRYTDYLEKIVAILIDEARSGDDLKTAIGAMHTMLSEISGINGAIKVRNEGYETKLRSGLALSPGYAADCLLDTVRTVQYIRALDAAIQQMKSEFPGQCINILYAGTGPFAPFALAMTERYGSDEIQFTALDIHLQSLDALRCIVSALEIGDYFRDFIQCDATEYRHPADTPVHIVITETMHRTVSREPHAAITLNLSSQLTKGGVFIPERVTVNASMSNTEKELAYLKGTLNESEIRDIRIDLGTVFELSADRSYEYIEDKTALVCSTVTIPDSASEMNEMVLSTHIQLFGPICIKEKESGITHPLFARAIEKPVPGDEVQFLFNLVGFPELTYHKLDRDDDIFSKLEKAAMSL